MYHFIINPKSRSGKGLAIWGQVHKELRKRNIDFRFYYTRYRGHARKLASWISNDLSEEDILAIIGGDGTVNEIINGLEEPSRITIGYIPTGSGNDFARGMNIPTDTAAAIELLLNPIRTQQTDIGCIQSKNYRRLFAVSAGIGFDAAICHEALSSSLKKILNKLHLGKLTYAIIAVKQLFAFQTATMELVLDNHRKQTLEHVYFTAVMNQQYEGGGFKFCPGACNNDGCLDVITIAGIPKWKTLLLFPIAFLGKHTGIKGVHIYRCRHINIKSRRNYHAHVDGEFAGINRQLCVSVQPQKLRVITR